METSELLELLSPDGLRLLDSLPEWRSTDDVLKSVASLRAAGHSPGLVAAVLSQSKLRAKAGGKFGPFADRMLFTEAGLEQGYAPCGSLPCTPGDFSRPGSAGWRTSAAVSAVMPWRWRGSTSR